VQTISKSLNDLYSPVNSNELPLRFGRDEFKRVWIKQAKGPFHQDTPASGNEIHIRSGSFTLLVPIDGQRIEFSLQYAGEKSALLNRLQFGQSSKCSVVVDTSQPTAQSSGSASLSASNANGKTVQMTDSNVTNMFFRLLPVENALEIGTHAPKQTRRLDGCVIEKKDDYSSFAWSMYSFAAIFIYWSSLLHKCSEGAGSAGSSVRGEADRHKRGA
jgi:hypothetical protein